MDITSYFLTEFVPLGIVIMLGAVVFGAYRLTRPTKEALARSDYVVFEAQPLDLPNIEADLADNGWRLTGIQTTATDARLYRFEKGGAGSASLSEIFDFERSMPRTSNRTSGGESLIKIRGHGASADSRRT